MKNMQHKSILLVLAILTISLYGFLYNSPKEEEASINLENAPDYEINRALPYISINKKGLKEAKTLVNINRHYKPSWVKEFVAVEISATQNGQVKQVISKSDQLNSAQKKLMNTADVGSEITVTVKYIPDNTLKHNDVKKFNFGFTVQPESDAKYIGGKKALSRYLEKSAIAKVPNGTFKNYDLAMIKFDVNEKGKVINAKLFNSCSSPKIDELLLETIRQMPDWKPAEYANGQKVKQEFVLAVGNMANCMMHTFNFEKRSHR